MPSDARCRDAMDAPKQLPGLTQLPHERTNSDLTLRIEHSRREVGARAGSRTN